MREDQIAEKWDVTYPLDSGWFNSAPPKLVVFDFDGTLVDQRGGWLLLQELFGIREQGKLLTDQYQDGELTFAEWCDENAALLASRGVTDDHILRAAAAVKFTRGAEGLLQRIGKSDIPFGTVSGGVKNLQDILQKFDPSFIRSNEILFNKSGDITHVEAAVGPNNKDEVLHQICADRGLSTNDVFYVGDSHTDEEAFDVAGLAVLFDPDSRIDDKVYEEVDAVVQTRDLHCVEQLFIDAIHY